MLVGNLEEMFEGFAGDLDLGDFFLTCGVRAQRGVCLVHLVRSHDLAFNAGRNVLADRRVAVPIASGHLHCFEDDHVVTAYNNMLELVHSRLKQRAPGSYGNIEMDFAFFPDREVLFIVCGLVKSGSVYGRIQFSTTLIAVGDFCSSGSAARIRLSALTSYALFRAQFPAC